MLVMACGLCLGGWRGTVVLQRVARYQPLNGQKITVSGIAVDDAVYSTQTQLAFDLQNITGPEGQRLPGKLGIKGFGADMVWRGDHVTVSGKLYPGRGSYMGWISFADLAVQHARPSPIDKLRRRFAAGMQSALPEPEASFGMGLLIGQRSTLAQQNADDLKHVGLTHIIAVSGYNLTIILSACRKLFGKRSKYQFTLISLLLIGTFLLLTGTSPSIVRAAIVSSLSLGAWYYGRTFKPQLLLLFTAFLTGYANPLYVWSDVSWYLSFLAFFGVMMVAPLLSQRLVSSERLRQSIIFSVALESLCAELVTLPYILHIFGQMSLVGLPANVLVTALVPLAMLLVLVAGLAGMLIPVICGWLAWPALMLLTYMLDTAHLLAGLPHTFIDNHVLTLFGMLALYSMLAVLVWLLGFKIKRIHAIITDENKHKESTGLDERTLQMVNH